tara:strand:- start:349 stop:1431 length:1083 start_codon:yes stop_codon:yes gene_type:complete
MNFIVKDLDKKKSIKKVIIFISFIFTSLRHLNLLYKNTINLKDNIKIIFFIPRISKGWIMEFLIKDLRNSNKNLFLETRYLNNLVLLFLNFFANPKSKIFCYTHGIAFYLIKRGFRPNDLILLYTHKKGSLNPVDLNKFHYVLFLNKQSKEDFISRGLKKEKTHYFPIGYDPKLFKIKNKKTSKKYDLVLALKYETEDINKNYYDRKNYKVLIPLLNKLSKDGLKICMVGRNWDKCKILDEKISCYNLPHNKTFEIYNQSKYSLCISIEEGGFVGMLETIACGCKVISHNVGFAKDLKELLPEKVTILKFLNSIDSYYQEIKFIINNQNISENEFENNNEISKKLSSFHFENLSERLLDF